VTFLTIMTFVMRECDDVIDMRSEMSQCRPYSAANKCSFRFQNLLLLILSGRHWLFSDLAYVGYFVSL